MCVSRVIILLFLSAVLNCALTGKAWAQTTAPADPIKVELDSAKQKREQAFDDAKKALLSALDERIKAVTKAGDLAKVTELQTARDTAAVDCTIPTSVKDAPTLAAKRKYDLTTASANVNLLSANKNAVRDYTRANRITEAQEVQKELSESGLDGQALASQIQNAKAVGFVLAKDFVSGSPHMLREGADKFSRLSYVEPTDTPSWAEWQFNVPTGKYYLHIQYTQGESRPAKLSINGKSQTGIFLKDITGGWDENTLRWVHYGPFQFADGENLVRLECVASTPHLKALALSMNSEPPK